MDKRIFLEIGVLAICVLAMLLYMPAAAAFSDWNRICVDNVLYKNTTIYYNNSAHIFNQTITCPYGCAANRLECEEPMRPDSGSLMSIVGVIGLAAVMFMAFAKFFTMGGDYSWPIQTLFMFASLLFVLMDISIVAGFALYSQDAIASVLNIAVVSSYVLLALTLFFLMMVIFLKVFRGWGKKNEAE